MNNNGAEHCKTKWLEDGEARAIQRILTKTPNKKQLSSAIASGTQTTKYPPTRNRP
jgi:hypothetical protein